MNYRNRKLLDAIATLPCQLCGAEDGTIVPAHANGDRWGKGMGIKAHDVFAAALCHKCHVAVDAGSGTREEKRYMWQRAWEATMLELFRRGLVKA